MKHAYRWTVLLGLALLSACGGGGGSSSGGGSTPPSSTYMVGGSVSGLTASGLVLLDNGGDTLSVLANATSFTFPTALGTGIGYAATIHTQPTGQTCVVTNGSGTVAAANVTGVGVSCGNVASVAIVPGPADMAHQTFNIPLTSVTVCASGTSHCATINDILVDTGSSGLRLMASVVAAAGLTLTPMMNSGAAVDECVPYADGYSWGAVATATVVIGGESTGSTAVPVQIIDDSTTPSPAAPSPSCTGYGTSLNSVDAFDANGVLGVGVANQDCGAGCVTTALNVYYNCTSGGACTATTQPLAEQVANPVASFAVDNNGVSLQLPTIPATGAPTATGSLTFGIGTESNNALGSATVLTADAAGNIITLYGNPQQTLPDSYFDSGSNGLYFPSSIATCATTPPINNADFYCPSTTQILTASNQGQNGKTSTASFQIANLAAISNAEFAINDVGGPENSSSPASGSSFDWGLPFFYGRTIYTVLENTTLGGANGAYAY